MTTFIFSGCVTGDGVPWRVADRAHARVEVQHLAQRDVQAADAAADRRRQRSLDGHLVRAHGLERVGREPLTRQILRLLTGEHFEPRETPGSAERLLHCRVEDAHARAPDVGPGAIALDERDDGIVGNDHCAVAPHDRCAVGWRFEVRELWHVPSCSVLGQFPGVITEFTQMTVEKPVENRGASHGSQHSVARVCGLHHPGATTAHAGLAAAFKTTDYT
jgi:hypothetical protein